MSKYRFHRNSHNSLRIKNRSILQWMVFVISLWPFLLKPLGGLPGVLGYSRYIADGVLLCMFLVALFQTNIKIRRSILSHVLLIITFFAYVLLVYLFRFQSPFFFLWGFRNNFRFYLAFFAFIFLLTESDVDRWFEILDMLFWINAVLSIVQFSFLGIRQDYLGGIFGIGGGSNGYTLLFFCIVIGRSLLATFSGQEELSSCAWKCISSLLIAAMAEMKFYFVVFIILIGMASFLTRFSVKKLLLILVGAVAVIWGTTLVVTWFGFDDFLAIEQIIEQATKENYSSANDLNRLSAIPTLSRTVLTTPIEQLFGLGLGNCDTSAFAICNTPFYQRYSYLHYTWFSAAMLFLEIGYVGLFAYFLFFILCFRYAFRQIKSGSGNQLNCQLAVMISILCCIITFYNSALRIEAGYLVYYVLAIPFIKSDES